LFGRERERAVLDRLLDGVRGGRGVVLVMHGEAGVGKTALLEYAVEAAPEFGIARTSRVQAEMELPFAAVEQLCSPFLDFLDPHRHVHSLTRLHYFRGTAASGRRAVCARLQSSHGAGIRRSHDEHLAPCRSNNPVAIRSAITSP
jgi:hypothetical protein